MAKTVEEFQRLLQQPEYSELETALIRKDGQRVDLWVAGEPLTKDGMPVAVYCTAKDITQRKQFQTELKRLVEERTEALKEATEQLNAFVYTLAHDFKAPLKAQSGFAAILLEDFGGALGQTGRQYAQRIADAASRQSSLINDLLKQVSLTGQELPGQPVQVTDVIKQVLDDLAVEVKERNAKISIGPLADACVIGNQAALQVVITNLVSNALKFVPEGTAPQVKIWSELRDGTTADPTNGTYSCKSTEMARIWVEDNGIGIRKEEQSKLFQAFQRLNAQSSYPGTGIGLVIVMKAIERLRGRCGLESHPGKGSRFWIELPTAKLTTN